MSVRIDAGAEPDDRLPKLVKSETLYMLVANDDGTEAAVMREALFENGYACDIVSSAEDVVRAFAARDYDLILVNLRSTLRVTLEAVRAIREHERHFPEPRVPLFILSAAANSSALEEAKGAGADDVMAKPRDYSEFCEILGRAASLERRTPQSLIPREPLHYQTVFAANEKDEARTARKIEQFAQMLCDAIRDVRTAIAAKDFELARRTAEQLRQTARELPSGRVQRTAYLLTKLDGLPQQAATRGRELLRELEQTEKDLSVWRELQLGQIVVGGESKTRSKVSSIKLSTFLKKRLDVFAKGT
jgi:CheY-like chemotaxis protein